jgi:hypothetical protein
MCDCRAAQGRAGEGSWWRAHARARARQQNGSPTHVALQHLCKVVVGPPVRHAQPLQLAARRRHGRQRLPVKGELQLQVVVGRELRVAGERGEARTKGRG